jgi:hypothetical protein
VARKGFGATNGTAVLPVSVPPPEVTYARGWNLVSGPPGTIFLGAADPIYTIPGCQGPYKTVPAAEPLGAPRSGYWAYFDQPATVTLPFTAPSALTVPGIAVSPGCSAMIGNQTYAALKITHVPGDEISVYVYDPAAGQYRQADELQPGQGALVISPTGGILELTAEGP